MRFSYLEHVAHEILPTIEIVWEISRTFHSDSDQYVSDYYQQIREMTHKHEALTGIEKLQAVIHDFYFDLGFSDAPEPIVGAQRILLDRVISYRTGLPVSLALLLQETAAYAGIQTELVDFPGLPATAF